MTDNSIMGYDQTVSQKTKSNMVVRDEPALTIFFSPHGHESVMGVVGFHDDSA